MAPSARFCDMDGWRLDWQSAHFMQYSHMIYSTSTYWQVCRVTRRCHAFGVAIRTTQRCLGHYRRLWTRQGWIWCRVHQQGKKAITFFWREAFEQKNKNRTKIYRTLFFVLLGASGMKYTCKCYVHYVCSYQCMYFHMHTHVHVHMCFDDIYLFFFCILSYSSSR